MAYFKWQQLSYLRHTVQFCPTIDVLLKYRWLHWWIYRKTLSDSIFAYKVCTVLLILCASDICASDIWQRDTSWFVQITIRMKISVRKYIFESLNIFFGTDNRNINLWKTQNITIDLIIINHLYTRYHFHDYLFLISWL